MPTQTYFHARSLEDLAAQRAADLSRIPPIQYADTLDNRKTRRAANAVTSPPVEAEMNACAVSSDVLQIEARGDGVFRILAHGWWGDFATRYESGRFLAHYVAGNCSVPNVAQVEEFEAARIEMDFEKTEKAFHPPNKKQGFNLAPWSGIGTQGPGAPNDTKEIK